MRLQCLRYASTLAVCLPYRNNAPKALASGLPNIQLPTSKSENDKDIAAGVLILTPCDWASVHAQAERLSRQRKSEAGHRAMDLLHLASALTLGATDFLTFDQNQAELATVLGLTVKP
jgi:hypothetical protein